MKVTLEQYESARTLSAQAAGGESGKSGKKAQMHQNTTGDGNKVDGGREVAQGGMIGIQSGVQEGVQVDIHGGVEGGVQGGVQGDVRGIESGIQKTTNLPHGFSFDPAEGFKLDDPRHEVGKTAKPMLMMNIQGAF